MSEAEGSTTRRGAKAFAVAIAVSQVCAFVRYVIFARALGPAELGWGVAIVLVGQFFDSVTDSGADRFLIQHPNGDDPEAQRLAQLVMVVRGVLIALLLLLFARPIADFLGAPEITFGLHLLALVPVFAGLIHLDWRRVQRDHDFRIEGRATLVAELGSLAVTSILAITTQSYLAVVAGLITRVMMLALVSQLMAVRRFAIGFSRTFGMELLLFALPLTVTGVLIFFGSQGDRVLISRMLGPAEVGRYSAIMLMMFYPMMVVQRYITALYLPQLVRHDTEHQVNAVQLGGVVTILGSLAIVGFAIVAPFALPILFGRAFAQAPVIVALIGVLNAARFFKLWPSNMLLAQGHSRGVMACYLMVLVAIPLALAGGYWLGSLEAIVLAFLAGELLSLTFGLWLSARLLDLRFADVGSRLILFVLAALVATAGSFAVERHDTPLLVASIVGGLVAAAVFWRREHTAIRFLLGLFSAVTGIRKAAS